MIATKPFISEQAMQHALENRKEFDPKEVRLSSIGTCQRKQVLGALEGMPPIAWEYDKGGHIIQEFLTRMIEEAFPEATIAREMEIKHPWGTAHIDIMAWIEEGTSTIIEVKTIKCAAFKFLNEPKPNNVLQVQGQMMFHEIDKGYKPQAEIIYLCRDHFGEHFKAFEIQFPNPAVMHDIKEQLKYVAGSIEKELVPGVPFEAPSWECSYRTKQGEVRCPFYDRCWEEKVEQTA